MPAAKRVTALKLRLPPEAKLDPDMRKYFRVCREKLGFVPNVLTAFSHDAAALRNFVDFYNTLMFGESGLSALEREMIAVVVSAANRCYYCLTAHGAAVRELSGSPELGEQLVMNWRVADLSRRQRAMLEFAHALTVSPAEVEAPQRAALRKAGWRDRDLWDIANVAAFFNYTNRLATAVDMRPNREYNLQSRQPLRRGKR
jgi:uncharacterized peroxidase-related enzyme